MGWRESLSWWLVYSGLVSLVVLTLGSGAVLLCRQPARRLRIIELSLAGCLIAPWLGMIPGYPQLDIGWRHAMPPQRHEAVALPKTEQAVVPVVPQRDAASPLVSDLPSKPIAETLQTPVHAWDVGSSLVAMYLLGVAIGVAWWLVGVAAVVRIFWTSRPAPPRCRQLLQEIAGGRSTQVQLLASRRASQPFAFAWGRVTIVLPENLCDDEQAVRWALAHEWTHVARHDFRAWFAAGLARVLFFYQPLVWWLRRQLRLCQDFVADAQASRQTPQPEDYAEFLTVRAAAGSRRPAMVGLGMGFRKSELYRRIIMLVQNPSLESRAPRRWTVAVTCAALVFVAAIAAISTSPQAAAQGESAAVKKEAKPAAVDPTSPSATGSFTAKFRNGISVELLGVSEHPSKKTSWWRPDGSPLAEPPCDPLKGSVDGGPGYVAREFALQWHNLPSEPVGTQVSFDPTYNAYAAAHPKRLGKDVAGLEAMTVSLPDQKTVTVRVNVAAGPWKTVGEGVSRSAIGNMNGGFAFSPIQEKDGTVTITVTHNIREPESRVVAVGLDGREHHGVSGGACGAANFCQITATFFNLSGKDIKAFRVQARPYEQVEFCKVSLQRGRKTEVRIIDSSSTSLHAASIELLEGTDVAVIRGKREDVRRIVGSLNRGRQADETSASNPSAETNWALLNERRDTLRQLVTDVEQRHRSGRATLDSVIRASNLLLDAELDLAKTKAERILVYEQQIRRLRALEKLVESRHKVGVPGGETADLLDAKAARLKAEIQLAHEKDVAK